MSLSVMDAARGGPRWGGGGKPHWPRARSIYHQRAGPGLVAGRLEMSSGRVESWPLAGCGERVGQKVELTPPAAALRHGTVAHVVFEHSQPQGGGAVPAIHQR